VWISTHSCWLAKFNHGRTTVTARRWTARAADWKGRVIWVDMSRRQADRWDKAHLRDKRTAAEKQSQPQPRSSLHLPRGVSSNCRRLAQHRRTSVTCPRMLAYAGLIQKFRNIGLHLDFSYKANQLYTVNQRTLSRTHTSAIRRRNRQCCYRWVHGYRYTITSPAEVHSGPRFYAKPSGIRLVNLRNPRYLVCVFHFRNLHLVNFFLVHYDV